MKTLSAKKSVEMLVSYKPNFGKVTKKKSNKIIG